MYAVSSCSKLPLDYLYNIAATAMDCWADVRAVHRTPRLRSHTGLFVWPSICKGQAVAPREDVKIRIIGLDPKRFLPTVTSKYW